MLLDWVTARVDLECFSVFEREALRNLGDRIQRFNPKTGELVWETAAWDSIRSDSHNLSYRVGSDSLWMQGSPARVIGDGDAVFGSGAAAALDLSGCVRRMRDMLDRAIPADLPREPAAWKVTRVDVTGNLDVGSLPRVRESLALLRNIEGGRYKVSSQAGSSVYWSHKSRLRAGKAYSKGPHLRYLMKQKTYDGRVYTAEEIELADRILRMELKLGAQWWRERSGKQWWEVTAEELKEQWREYFERMIGECQVNEMNIEDKVIEVASTERQAKAAIRLWLQIKGGGWEQARNMTNKTTWYRNLKILRQAGLSDADFSAGKVVELRRGVIAVQDVRSWDELRRLAA